ncbi:MAG TPA: hypothetical protein DCM54_00775 [Gammaproteobacteria bacterium]|nr:hypothetical protein [Gammaproteobacteria bacterium]
MKVLEALHSGLNKTLGVNLMKNIIRNICMVLAAFLTNAASSVYGQDDEIEEVVVQARLLSGAEALVSERIDDDVVSDVLGAEFISRVGDSTVAAALRRISGLTLVGSKFVYVRGLGERYSSSSLNGAAVPSPDLTRNVLPLDIFPTSIVQSLSVKKGYSADQSAAFGGGTIDIRTKGIPSSFTYGIEIGSGFNSEVDGELLSYAGGGDDDMGTDDGTRAFPQGLNAAIVRFRGELDSSSILQTLRGEGMNGATSADSRAVNRQLALNLNRNISITPESDSPDLNIRGNVGNKFMIGENIDFGILVGASYGSQWRKTETISRTFQFPEDEFEDETETTRSIDLNANLNMGLVYTDDHEISTTTLYIRNTDDETAQVTKFNENRRKSDGIGFRDDVIKFEEREMIVNQIKGTHYLGAATRERFPWLDLSVVPEDLRYDWFYSEARAFTEIPNEVKVQSVTTNDLTTGAELTSNVSFTGADYRFTDLEDEVINFGGTLTLPLEFTNAIAEIKGGWTHTQKIRIYRQTQFGLSVQGVSDQSVLEGPLGSVFSDANITNPLNNYVFNLIASNGQSYLAVTKTDAAFGNVDWTWNDTWRVSAGARWEEYRQVSLPWNPNSYSFNAPQISIDADVLEDAVFTTDEYYPAVSVTYMTDWWAEIFQLRFGWSETVVRPDLREITDASYIDARTGFLTDGDSSVVPSAVENYDLRAEWFFSSGDNLTVSFYYKDIDSPIEFFERAASDTNRSREIVNAESGEVFGIEIEGLKNLVFLGDSWEQFFIQGNLTIQDSELKVGSRADAPTRSIRELAGASEYVVNFLVGFDSSNRQHSSTLSYNVFGERLFTAGRNGAPDAFEQPLHSVDFTYSWYPTDAITLKLKIQNLLDESVEIKRENIVAFTENLGTSFSLTFQWHM